MFKIEGLYKKYYFLNEDRNIFNDIKIGDVLNLYVKDKDDNIIFISFCVTRNTFLGTCSRRIYGHVLDSQDDEYYQIEIKIRHERWLDTIEVFRQAPPINF